MVGVTTSIPTAQTFRILASWSLACLGFIFFHITFINNSLLRNNSLLAQTRRAMIMLRFSTLIVAGSMIPLFYWNVFLVSDSLLFERKSFCVWCACVPTLSLSGSLSANPPCEPSLCEPSLCEPSLCETSLRLPAEHPKHPETTSKSAPNELQ